MTCEEARKYPRVFKNGHWPWPESYFNCSCCGAVKLLGTYVTANSQKRLYSTCKCGAKYSVLRYEVVLEKPSPQGE